MMLPGPIGQNPLYLEAMSQVCQLHKVSGHERQIINEKVQATAQRVLAEGDKEVDPAIREEALAIAESMGIIEESDGRFSTILQAVIDFNNYSKAAASEVAMFSVASTPAPTLTTPSESPPYTLLTHSARSASDLVNIAKVFDIKGIRSLIPLQPSRLILHQLCTRFVLEFQIPTQGGVSFE